MLMRCFVANHVAIIVLNKITNPTLSIMKRLVAVSFFLCIGIAPMSLFAQESIIASIFNSQDAQIQIPFSATVSENGKAYFSLPQLPLDSRSLSVQTDQTISTYYVERREQSRLWDELKGENITLSNGTMSLLGELTDVSGQSLILKSSNGQFIRIPDANNYVLTTSSNINPADENEASGEQLVIHSNLKKGKKITGNLLFDTRGLRWESRHTLTINSDLEVKSLFSKAILYNQTNADIANLTPILVFGEQNNSFNRRETMEMAMMAKESQRADYGSVSQNNVGSSGDLFFFRFDDTITLPADAEHHHNLMTARDLESSQKYSLSLRGYDQPDSWMFPDATITIPSKSISKHIKNALPGGSLAVYMDQGNNELMAYTNTSVPVLVNGADLDIPVGEAKTIRVKEEITNRTNITNTITETTFKVTVQNLKEELTKIELTRYIHGNQRLIFDDLDFEQMGTRLVATVETGSKQTRTFTYKVRTER